MLHVELLGVVVGDLPVVNAASVFWPARPRAQHAMGPSILASGGWIRHVPLPLRAAI